MASGQKRGQQILHVVGVLVLVNEHVAELVLVVGQHFGLLLQETHGVEDDVVEVQGSGLPQPLLVEGVQAGDLL